MVRQFKTGGVYTCELDIKDDAMGASFLIKVVGFDRTLLTRPWDRLRYRIFGNDTQAIELIGGTPSCVRTAAIEADEYGNDAEMVSMYFPEPSCDIYHIFISSSRVILKTGVLLFCATKLIVLARRVKERMYACTLRVELASSQQRKTLTVPPSPSVSNGRFCNAVKPWFSIGREPAV